MRSAIACLTFALAAAAASPEDIVFTADFESPEWYKEWGVDKPEPTTDTVGSDPARKFEPHRGKALRVRVPRGGNTGSNLQFRFAKHTGSEPDQIYFRYYLRLGDDWNPESQGGKLPGISGTYNRAGWGGRPVNGTDGWSARGSFGRYENGETAVGFYTYHVDMRGKYGSIWNWDGERLGYLKNNRWYAIEQHIRLNTPGKNDGVMRAWIDGRLAFEKTDVRFRDTRDLKVEMVWLNVYQGGTKLAETDDHLFIDDVVIARKYIGPAVPASVAQWEPPYPRSTYIKGMKFRDESARTLAPGSDIWPITWAADDHLYTTFGDGGGFGGTNREGRVSLGFARVEGGPRDYRGVNLAAPFTGKSEGVLALGNTLYWWRDGEGSDQNTFAFEELYRSDDKGMTWKSTGVRFTEDFFAPAFLQFGKGYEGARDEFVYIYAVDIVDRTHWEMRRPGRVNLIRVPKGRIEDRSAYEFLTGLTDKNQPTWSPDPSKRKPVWEDAVNGSHRMAVSYNPGLKRYLLSTVTVRRDGWMSVYDAPEPWGPWTLVHVEQNVERWGGRVILFTFVNKWLRNKGRDFVIVHTKNDAWATIEGTVE